MNTDILFQNLSENPAFNTPVAEKTINEIKILDLRYTEEIDIIFMTSHVAKVKYGKKFNPNNSKQILSIIAPCFNYGGIIDKEGNILLTEELTKKIKEQTVEIGENKNISIVDAIILTGIAPSKGQARTLINQGGISLNDNKISDVNYVLSDTDFKDGYAILKKGKKVFYKLV